MSETRVSAQHVALPGTPTLIGAVLGSYRITSALGAGGMGMVFRAQHELLERPAAIKLLRPELTANDELVQRFFNEAKAATAIRHPGIIEVYDFGYTADGLAYLVMELLDGAPLGRYLAERGRLPEPEAIRIARGIASALRAAHDKGIFHRDLKPDNIFLVPDPDGEARIKVLDFGVAKLANPSPDDRRTRTGVLMGTPRYMAPEQAREAGTIDHRADLYSLGCILYELLVGEPPFVAEGAGEVIALQLFAEPVPPSQRVDAISPALEALVLRLLAKEPADRPASAHAVVQELARISGHASGPVAVPRRAVAAAPVASVSTLDTLPAVDAIPAAPPVARRAGSALPLVAATVTLLLVGVAVVVLARSRGGAAATPDAAPVPSVGPIVVPPDVASPMTVEPAPPAPPAPIDVPVVIESGGAKRPRRTSRPKQPAPPAAPRPTRNGPITEKGSPYEVQLDDTVQKEP